MYSSYFQNLKKVYESSEIEKEKILKEKEVENLKQQEEYPKLL